jgi:hypothetical protein
MIFVKRTGETTSQKVITAFIKRAKKYNLVARKRKTTNFTKAISELQKHRKAVRKAKYLEAQLSGAKLAKKI